MSNNNPKWKDDICISCNQKKLAIFVLSIRYLNKENYFSTRHYFILKNGILNEFFVSLNIALLDKCISQYSEHPVFALGSIL